MDFIDFLIGLSMMHAMPHIILGIWNRKMYSPFGNGKIPNLIYGFCLIAFSFCLFIIKYGLTELPYQGIYVGAISMIAVYLIVGPALYKKLRKSKRR